MRQGITKIARFRDLVSAIGSQVDPTIGGDLGGSAALRGGRGTLKADSGCQEESRNLYGRYGTAHGYTMNPGESTVFREEPGMHPIRCITRLCSGSLGGPVQTM